MTVTITGGAAPGPLVLTSGQQAQADLFLPWSSKAACPWCPAIVPDAVHRPRPGATATSVQK
ncbi:MAG TPA: hypothetical protein VGA79_10165 [Desulfobaccales bacterium]